MDGGKDTKRASVTAIIDERGEAQAQMPDGGTVDARLPSGSRMPVPVNANRHVPNTAIAKAAGKIGAKAIPGVATALAIAELVDLLGDSYRVNAGTVEKAVVGPDAPPFSSTQTGWLYAPTCTAQKLCTITQARDALLSLYVGYTFASYATPVVQGQTTLVNVRARSPSGVIAPLGTLSITGPTQPAAGTFSPATADQIETDLLFRFQNGVSNVDAYEVIRRGESVAGPSWPAEYRPIDRTTPVTIESPETSSPPRNVSTTTRDNADGSTDTITVTERDTIKPTVTGTTVGDTRITYPSTTTTTTTTTNNVTNNTTTTTTIVNNPPVKDEPVKELEIPDDYNREVTQEKVLKEITAASAPTLPSTFATDVTTKIETEEGKLKTLIEGVPTQFTDAKDNWFSWVWTPPMGSCENPVFPVRGQSFTLSICDWVERIREAIGWVFAMYAAINVYGLMFPAKGQT